MLLRGRSTVIEISAPGGFDVKRPSKNARAELAAFGFPGTTPAAIVPIKRAVQGGKLNDLAQRSGDQPSPFSSVLGWKFAIRAWRDIGLRRGSAVQTARSDDLGAGGRRTH
jgi:hypothetical protein